MTNSTSLQTNKPGYLVVTDLDGTLLDHDNYSWDAAKPALTYLREQQIPVVINTSKTAAEVKNLQKFIGLDTPFIVENGSAIFLPKLQFKIRPPQSIEAGIYWVKLIGEERKKIVNVLQQLRKKYAWKFEGFSDWSPSEIAQRTNLSLDSAVSSAAREFSEPIVWQDNESNFNLFLQEIEKQQLKMLRGGRFIHILGNANKGASISWLRSWFRACYSNNYKIIALGDGPNDIDMLKLADFPVAVKSPAHDYPVFTSGKPIIHTEHYGPAGWNEAINLLKAELK